MKERNRPVPKRGKIQVISQEAMTADQQSDFNKAIESLLAEWVRHIDGRNKGESHGNIEEQMAG